MRYSADAEYEIIHCVNCEISHSVRCEMKFALPICEANISQRSYFTWALPNFTRRRRISLKKESKSFDLLSFFWRRHPESHSATGTVSVANRILLPAAAEPSPMEGCVNPKRKTSPLDWFSFWRRHPESDRGIKVLQTSALPLGYGAVFRTAILYHGTRLLSMLF